MGNDGGMMMQRVAVLGLAMIILASVNAQENVWDQGEEWIEEDYEDTAKHENTRNIGFAQADAKATRVEAMSEHKVEKTEHQDAMPAARITEHQLAHKVMAATMDGAGVDEKIKNQALAQLTMRYEKQQQPQPKQTEAIQNSQTTKCSVFAEGNQVGKPMICPTGTCITNRIQLVINGSPKMLYTSNCDKMRLCDGMGKGYYRINDGSCGKFPGKGGQEIYCTKQTPQGGIIPKNVQCPVIKLDLNGGPSKKQWEDDYNAASSLGSNVWLMMGATLAVVMFGR